MLKHCEEKRIKREQVANLAVQKEHEEQAAQSFTPYWNFPMINDDDEHTIQYRLYLENSSNAITPIIPTEEPEYYLSMGYKHLSTILETESDEVIKFSVENLVPIPNEFEDFFDNEKSLLNRDISTISYPKIDSFLEELSGELARIDLVPPGINKADFDPEE
nr:hypothetical protein [Tanacetum cinerariifolium]